MIHTSVPDRGLLNILAMWPQIRQRIPDATLRITSDYRLWGRSYPSNEKYFTQFMGMSGVIFPVNTALLRKEYLNELCKSNILFYPHQAMNPELFCVSMAEAQYAGAYPVSSDIGALNTTNMGCVLPGNPEESAWHHQCIDKIVELLTDRKELVNRQGEVVIKAFQRFHPDTVLSQWEERVFV